MESSGSRRFGLFLLVFKDGPTAPREVLEFFTGIDPMLARLVNALEAMEDGFALFDDNQRLVLCNDPYCRMVGVPSSEALVGKAFASLMHEWFERVVLSGTVPARIRVESVMQSGSALRWDLRTRDGGSVRLTIRPTRDGGLAAILRDRNEDVLQVAELQRARSEAEVESKAKSEFLSGMSFALKTPLNAILGYAQLLQRDRKDPLSARNQGRVDQILHGGEDLLHVIDGVRDLTEIEAGRVPVSLEPTSVSEIVDEVQRMLQPAAARAGVRIHLETPSLALPAIAADRSRLVQILMSFGANAIKYNRPAGGTIRFGGAAAGLGQVRLTVADNGLGIPRDKQDKVFQPFQRAGRDAGAGGVGLAIAKRLAELMNGRVGFQSVPDVGSEFWVELPVHAGHAP